MKITCQRESLTNAFALAASIAPARSPKEILQNVKVTAASGKITLTATDMEVGIRLDLEEGVTVETEGTALLPVQRTMAILRENNDEVLEFETDESGIRVKGKRSKFKLPGNNPDEFPAVAGFDEDKYHVLPTRLFREMVKRTVFATDSDSSRFVAGIGRDRHDARLDRRHGRGFRSGRRAASTGGRLRRSATWRDPTGSRHRGPTRRRPACAAHRQARRDADLFLAG